MALASSSVVPWGAVTRFFAVISAEIGSSVRASKRRSRLVRMPTSVPSSRVIGTPEMRYFLISSRASATFCSGRIVMGFTIMPLSERFTLSTSSAWASIDRFLCRMPIPPSWAIAIARRASVTVSIAAETMGMLRRTPGARLVETSAVAGNTLENAGISSTSSNVSPSGIASRISSSPHPPGHQRGW